MVSSQAVQDYGEKAVDNMVSMLSLLLIKSISVDSSRDSRRLTKLTRGIMKELGISSSRRSDLG